ncbi:MAG: sulfatase-like hydrolase/transferase [Sphingobium sp.]
MPLRKRYPLSGVIRRTVLLTGSAATLLAPSLLPAQTTASGSLPSPAANGYTAKAGVRYGHTPEQSPPPAWPQPERAPAGAPNVLIIMTDDVGFASSSTFGGAVPTPTFDALAREGLRYNRFHTTAICSPTRAALLTGRNPQAVGMGYTANWPTGYDGYNSVIPKSAGTLPQILKESGYNTAMFGKGHITPEWEMGPSGPFDRWPTGLGFEYYYGFLGADTSAFEPSLVENTRPVTPVHGPDYHLDRDLADHAIRWLDEHEAAAPDKPFFIYFAPGTAHAPNHAPAEWLAKFRGKFDKGWDALRAETVARQRRLGIIPPGTADAPRPAHLQKWDELPENKRKLYARYMEAYAASLAYADHEIGRVIDELKRTGAYENTLILYIQGDNGASAEGSFEGKLFEQSGLSGVSEDPAMVEAHIDDIGTKYAYNLNPGGWGWAMNAPFQWDKRYASHLGGIRNGMVLSWAGHIKDPGGLRSQFLHVSDIMPTILDIAGITPPETLDGVKQQPITGASAAYSIADGKAPTRRATQLFAMTQNLSIYHDGWMASTTPWLTPWEPVRPSPVAPDARHWELYNLDTDFSQSKDLARRYPKRLAEMIDLFWKEADEAGILPIHTSEGRQQGVPNPNAGRTSFTYLAPMTQLPEGSAPHVVGQSFTIRADVETGEQVQGVLAAHGGRYGGYSLYFDEGRPAFTFNLTPAHMTRIVAGHPLPPGQHRITLDFVLNEEKPASGGMVTLSVDDAPVASGRVAQTFARVISHSEGFDIGQDLVSPVDPSYTSATSRFNGRLERLTFTIRH